MIIFPELGKFLVKEESSIEDAIRVIDLNAKGVCLVTRKNKHFLGLLTDGDIRRLLLKFSDRITTIQPVNYINLDFIFINQNKKAIEALEVMENRSKPLNFLLVVSDDNKIIGIIRLHELYKLLK